MTRTTWRAALAALGFSTLALASAAEVPAELEAFEPFVGKTWAAVVDAEKGTRDVARWERALAGQAVRILHSVGDGAYGGETLVMWDKKAESLVYYYFTTAGFYTRGTMELDAEAATIASRETVTGNEAGVTEVEATQRLLPDGRMEVITRMKVKGAWVDRGTVFYAEAPDAEVVLPAE